MIPSASGDPPGALSVPPMPTETIIDSIFRVPNGLKSRSDKSGYQKVDLGRGNTKNVHRLVWDAFHGPIPASVEVNHRNGDKNDSRLENLELVTRSQNMAHAYASGLMRKRRISPPPGANAFQRWLCEKGPVEIAVSIGKSQALVYAWIHGRSKPKPKDLEAMGYTPSSCDSVTQL